MSDVKYDDRHGGPYDRGSADAYYRRRFNPHYYKGDTMSSDRVEGDDMTQEELNAYAAGYQFQKDLGEFKDWG